MVKHTTASFCSKALLLLLTLCSFAAARDIASSTNLAVTADEAAADPKNPLHYLPTNSLTVMAVRKYSTHFCLIPNGTLILQPSCHACNCHPADGVRVQNRRKVHACYGYCRIQ